MMRKILWKITVLTVMVLLSRSIAFAEDFRGWADLSYNTTKQFEDGNRTSDRYTFNRNFNISMDKSITPMLSYKVFLRTMLSDTDSTDSDGRTTSSYRRTAEPTIDFSLGNPMYNLGVGYRLREQWSTVHLVDESRRTTKNYYSRLNIAPYALPSFSLEFDRQENYDHLSVKETDRTSTGYSVSSAYTLPSDNLKLSYYLSYARDTVENPLSITDKSINDNFGGSYNLGYSSPLWGGKAGLSVSYKGRYMRNKDEQFVTRTGSVLFKRTSLGGLHAAGSAINKDVGILSSEVSLVDENFDTATGIDLSAAEFHNIGIWVFSEKSVDRLFIYVNKNVSTDVRLTNARDWSVYRSEFNQAGTWTTITIKSVTVTPFDTLNNIYRYEIEFSSAQNASYFKAVNMETSDAAGVLITEIEAYGTDDIPDTNILTTISTSFTQGLNFSANARPLPKLNFSLSYSIDRADQNPLSIEDSIAGIFTNIFTKSIADEEENLSSNITRGYGAGASWMIHRLLNSSLNLYRNEKFDNKGGTDVNTNTYSLSFNSAPLPTIDTSLSLIRSSTYSFDEKESTNNSILLNIGSRLYRYLNMITDMGYTESKSFITDTQSSARYISGSLDASLTRKLSGNLRYGFIRTSSDSTSSGSRSGSMIATYRPARFINLSGRFKVSDSDGNTSTSEDFSINWLPLPVIRLNANFKHTRSPGPSTSNSFSSFGTWHVTKLMNVRLTYNYAQKVEKGTESHSFRANLNGRF